MGLTWWTRLPALRNHGAQWGRLVQRIGRTAEHPGALRSEVRNVPDLADPLWRWGGAQHDAEARSRAGAGRERCRQAGARRYPLAAFPTPFPGTAEHSPAHIHETGPSFSRTH